MTATTPESASRDAAHAVALTDLIDAHTTAVFRLALSVVRDPALAEDVVQETFIKAWQALDSYRGDAPLRNWGLRIAHNTSVSMLRSRRDELREPDRLPETETRHTVERAVEDTIALDRLAERLGELDEMTRSIVVLREVEGLSYDEISDVLDLPLPTVKTRLLRGRRKLSVSLQGWRP